jgi:hypothetical protein
MARLSKLSPQFFQRWRGALGARGQLKPKIIEHPYNFSDADIDDGPVFDLAQRGASDFGGVCQRGLRQLLSPSRFPDGVAEEKKHSFLTSLFYILNIYNVHTHNISYTKQSQAKNGNRGTAGGKLPIIRDHAFHFRFPVDFSLFAMLHVNHVR